MADDFKPGTGRKVTRADAQSWIDRYDQTHRPDKTKDTKSIFFGKQKLQEILDTEGAAGISIFLAMKYSDYAKRETVNLVLIPTKEDGTLIYVGDSAGKDPGDSYVWDEGMLCPPTCP